MLCCCARDRSTSYAVEESSKSAAAQSQHQPAPAVVGDTKIITGKGPLSTSSQNLAAAGEANLDKSTISAAKREKSPITEQPIANHTQQATQAQQPQEGIVNSKEGAKPVTSSEQPKSVSVISVTKPESSQLGAIEKAIESSTASCNALEASPTLPSPTGNLESLNSSLDKIEKELSEAESIKSAREAKALVPGLADQVKVLTSQVLGQSASGMGDQGLGAAVSRLEAVASRLEALAVGKSSGGGDPDEVAQFVVDYDDLVATNLTNFMSISNDVGGDVQTQVALVKQALDEHRAFLVVASKHKQPDQYRRPRREASGVMTRMWSGPPECQKFRAETLALKTSCYVAADEYLTIAARAVGL
ncbi:adenylyl cyclase-associated protein [Elysia marginata]|uniref:Adenylyl cyclase-associated protein n=1 Tax=Elysia marginata TaxID=1093978 RepID=A0AAV4JZF5_9GAST|nr:adenylyl cyclase-associated protein [Elysia marginata]